MIFSKYENFFKAIQNQASIKKTNFFLDNIKLPELTGSVKRVKFILDFCTLF
jgi:hypothetical protein